MDSCALAKGVIGFTNIISLAIGKSNAVAEILCCAVLIRFYVEQETNVKFHVGVPVNIFRVIIVAYSTSVISPFLYGEFCFIL